MDPGLAFGTGHHPTTKMCLELAETLITPDSNVLDLGCGSAILSIAAAKLGAKSVVALDIDKQAIKAADQNVIRNDVSQIVTTSIGTINDISTEKRYQIIFANISSKIIIDILPKIEIYLDTTGKAILCGIVFDLPTKIRNDFSHSIKTLLIKNTSDDWLEKFGNLKKFYNENGHSSPQQGIDSLGSFCNHQRQCYKKRVRRSSNFKWESSKN